MLTGGEEEGMTMALESCVEGMMAAVCGSERVEEAMKSLFGGRLDVAAAGMRKVGGRLQVGDVRCVRELVCT